MKKMKQYAVVRLNAQPGEPDVIALCPSPKKAWQAQIDQGPTVIVFRNKGFRKSSEPIRFLRNDAFVSMSQISPGMLSVADLKVPPAKPGFDDMYDDIDF